MRILLLVNLLLAALSMAQTRPFSLRDWLVAAGITVSFLPTAIAETVMGLAWPSETSLRYLLAGGDALTRRPPADLRAHRRRTTKPDL